MTGSIDLIWLGEAPPPAWPAGCVWTAGATPREVAAAVASRLLESTAEAWLFWHGRLGAPDATLAAALLKGPGDVWHAGLRLGMAGLPGMLDFIAPGWMLTCDPPPDIEATSWRLPLDACLVRSDVLRRMGGPDPAFATLSAAGLEMGHRWITGGAIVRHIPALAPGAIAPPPKLPLADEMRFIRRRAARWQRYWSAFRAILSGYAGPVAVLRAWRQTAPEPRLPAPPPCRPTLPPDGAEQPLPDARVTVLIPTVDRYSYLRVLLDQLRRQTVPPHEIIVIDQTAPDRRDAALAADFADLPLRLITLGRAGQCSSRNAGLQQATGDHILFVDDDDEAGPDLIAHHLRHMQQTGARISCGAADEVGAGPLPPHFTYPRVSDVFPTNNSLISRDVLRHSGLFDLAYERGTRADGDLGMRLYLSGQLMMYNPAISVLHHHAPSGGLRKHKARVNTYAASRQKIAVRVLPGASEVYLWRRYYTPGQVRENLWLVVLGTFSIRGGIGRKLLKGLVSLIMLPETLWKLRGRCRAAAALLESYPQIPALEPSAADAEGER